MQACGGAVQFLYQTPVGHGKAFDVAGRRIAPASERFEFLSNRRHPLGFCELGPGNGVFWIHLDGLLVGYNGIVHSTFRGQHFSQVVVKIHVCRVDLDGCIMQAMASSSRPLASSTSPNWLWE